MEWKAIDQITDDEKYNDSLLLFSEEFMDPDFNRSGVVEGYWNDDEGFIGAFWNNCQDTWFARTVQPTHYAVKKGPDL